MKRQTESALPNIESKKQQQRPQKKRKSSGREGQVFESESMAVSFLFCVLKF